MTLYLTKIERLLSKRDAGNQSVAPIAIITDCAAAFTSVVIDAFHSFKAILFSK